MNPQATNEEAGGGGLSASGLLACPFCGAEPRRVKIETQLPTGAYVLFRIECSRRECGATTRDWYPLAAAEASWQHRHPNENAASQEAVDIQGLVARLPHVKPAFVEEVKVMSLAELQRRVLILSDWHGAFSCSLDGIKEIALMPGRGIDGCRSHEDVRHIVEQLVKACPLTWWDSYLGRPKEAGSKPLASPALTQQSDDYPPRYRGRVPRKIKMVCTVRPDDLTIVSGFTNRETVAHMGIIYECWVNSHGAVVAICANGDRIGVKPEEFDVVEWHAMTPNDQGQRRENPIHPTAP